MNGSIYMHKKDIIILCENVINNIKWIKRYNKLLGKLTADYYQFEAYNLAQDYLVLCYSPYINKRILIVDYKDIILFEASLKSYKG